MTANSDTSDFCCLDECCGGGSWCCSHANPGHACSGDDELPGMWSHADFLGGPPDEVRGADWVPQNGSRSKP
jgi:hypothetical protein